MTPGATQRVRPRRDRATLVSYASNGLVGWFFYGMGTSVALVRDELGLTRIEASLVGISLAVGTVIGAVVVTPLSRRLGRGRVLRASSALVALGVLLYTTGGPLPLLAVGAALGALGCSFVIVAASAFLSAHQRAAGDAALTEANVATGIAQFLAPLLTGIAATTVLGWRASLWLLVLLCIAVEILRGRDLAAYGDGGPRLARAGQGGRRPLGPRYPFAAGALLLIVAVDTSVLLWGADLLRDRGGFGPAAAAAAFSVIVGGFIVGRIVGARLVESIGADVVLIGSLALAIVAFFATWAASGPIMLVWLALTGIGLGPQFALGLARAMRATDGQPDRGAGIATAANGLALAVAPFLLATLADTYGVHRAFLVVLAFLAVSLLLVVARPVASAAAAASPEPLASPAATE